jgi:hypothetical protein
MGDRLGTPHAVDKSSWGLAHPMSLTELALLDGRRPLPLWDVIGLTLTLTEVTYLTTAEREHWRKNTLN